MAQSSQPEVFGAYHLLEKIATGGMAEVYRARAYGMAGFEKILVIKKVLPEFAADQEFVKLFIDEARIAVQLLHVNIVQVFDLGEVDGQFYMAMEYVHGLDLSRLITRSREVGPFPVALALFLGAEVLKALHFAHERRGEDDEPLHIVHCDISPQNILVSYAGEVKITDFGISRAAFQASHQHEVVRGKYAYMSPEQVEGLPLDGRSDVFSLGIVLYEVLTGQRLFKAKSRDETLNRVRRADVPSPRAVRSAVSPGLEALLRRALARRPEDRFADAGEMVDHLRQLMVREGHRATNNDLAAYLRSVLDTVAPGQPGEPSAVPARRSSGEHPPVAVVVLAIEANRLADAVAGPRASPTALVERWAVRVAEAGGEIWERGEGSLLVVWVAGERVRDHIARAVEVADSLQQMSKDAGHRLSAGVVPGVVRIGQHTRRPAAGWELAGPFYLARWMMNLSAHRGRVLLTEVGAREVEGRTRALGCIPIQGNRTINLHELR